MQLRDTKFIIIVPVYNAENYIERCLESVLTQTYKNYELCVMDDCSTDTTWQIIGRVCNKYNGGFNMCRNEYRLDCALANFVKGIELFSLDKEDVLCLVDGDDYLYDNSALSHLNNVYQDENIWMTYGQYIPASGDYPPFCKPIADTRNYRHSNLWYASHIRTCKRKLWDKVRDEDMRGKDGKYYKRVADCAYFWPMIEMCGHGHMKFIDKILYVYNDLNPTNEMKVNKEEMLALAEEIKNKPPYDELTEL